MISLIPVTETNFKEITALSMHDYQIDYVASPTYSLAQCYIYRDNNDVFPFAIVVQNQTVGFLLLDEDLEKKELLIWRIIIDKQEQGKGFGKDTLIYLINLLKGQSIYKTLAIHCVEKNNVMSSLIHSLGFGFIGQDTETGEKMFCLSL